MGGNATAEVVRIGDTVRKPWTAATPAVVEYMQALSERGVDVPRTLGRDAQGRRVVEFVPGPLAIEAGVELSEADLGRVGRLIRAIHDASQGLRPSGHPHWDLLLPVEDADLICHNDLAPWNLVVGPRWLFIDWDGAGPSTRLWDLAYAAQAFTLNDPGTAPVLAAQRLSALIDGYGAGVDLRGALPETMGHRAEAMHELLITSHRTGRLPWGRMFVEGHGAHWRAAADYVVAHRSIWAEALQGPPEPLEP